MTITAGSVPKNGNGGKTAINKNLYTLIKLPLKELIAQNFHVLMDRSQAAGKEYLIKQGPSLIFRQIERLRGHYTRHISEVILVVAKKNPRQEEALRRLLEHGFTYNGTHYSRFGKSASQGKEGITAFVCDGMFDELYRVSQMDIPIKQCVISKYEAQRCLIFSSCTPIDDYVPNIVIVGEYEKLIPNQLIKYVVQRERTLTDKETGELKAYQSREIEEGCRDITISPFDGCGCHEEAFMNAVNGQLKLDYDPIGFQIRMPFVKGYSVYMPFRKILREWGHEAVTDIYGVVHPLDTIDCIWNISMFKGHQLFSSAYGNRAWEEYMNTFLKYRFQLGISKYSHHTKHLNKMARMNFQYLQCLDLWNPRYVERYEQKNFKGYDILAPENEGKIIAAAKYTTALYEQIIKGDPFYTFKFLGVIDSEEDSPESRYLEAALINSVMLKDPAVKQFICRKLGKLINEAKVGKIYADGFYHTVVGDMIGYLQYAAGLEVTGCLKAREFFCRTLKPGRCLSLRSPLVCPSEVNEITLVSNAAADRWLSHFQDQDLVMLNLHDLSAPQQGGMDYDGDIVFLCRQPLFVEAKIDKPIIIDIDDKATAVSLPYTKENLIDYEVLTRDNRIGEITNTATSIENKYTVDPEQRQRYSDFSSLLRVFQGKEIDFLKTGFRWHLNSGLRKHLKKLPYFLLYNYPDKLKTYEKLREKGLELNAYHSPSPMNELCEYICTWEKKHILWNRETADTGPLLRNPVLDVSDSRIRRLVRRAINDYAADLKTHLELEQHFNRDALIDSHKNRLRESLGLSEEQTAEYVIAVSYGSRSISKSFAWTGYGRYLIDNLKRSSGSHFQVRISPVYGEIMDIPATAGAAESSGPSEVYEYLGKFYQYKTEP